jgi:protein tyrosine/serine phosphatase
VFLDPNLWACQYPAMIQNGLRGNAKPESALAKVLRSAAFLFPLLMALAAPAAQRGLPAQDGVLNFGKINENLFRGAQPDEPGIVSLKKLGIRTIISLRKTNDLWKAEESVAKTNGITFVNVPMSGLGRPTVETVHQILQIIDSSSSPVFIHCEHGCDRTGTLIACYRIMHDQWTSDAALKEAKVYGMSSLERGMKRFVQDFAKALKQ